jgi:hypothetical protein
MMVRRVLSTCSRGRRWLVGQRQRRLQRLRLRHQRRRRRQQPPAHLRLDRADLAHARAAPAVHLLQRLATLLRLRLQVV